jgi:hypothetical protein
MSDTDAPQPGPRRIFLSHVHADKEVAQAISDAIRTAGLHVSFADWELAAGDSIAERIEERLASTDVLVVLLSPDSLASRWVADELSTAMIREIRDRAIAVIPALIGKCELPPLLASWAYVDLRSDLDAGIQRLVRQVGATSVVRFSQLDARAFESLVADLLVSLGFSVQLTPVTRDGGADIIANWPTRDPFDGEKKDTWIVQAKFYQEKRVSVDALRQMLGFLMTSSGVRRGLIVTNSGLTSVARDLLSEWAKKSGPELRVIDGTELTSLLLSHPDLVQRYFGQAAKDE